MKAIKIKMTQQDIKGFMTLQLIIIDYLREQQDNPCYIMQLMLEGFYDKLAETAPYLRQEATISIGLQYVPIFAIGIAKIIKALAPYEQAIAININNAIDAAVTADRKCRENVEKYKMAKQTLIG